MSQDMKASDVLLNVCNSSLLYHSSRRRRRFQQSKPLVGENVSFDLLDKRVGVK